MADQTGKKRNGGQLKTAEGGKKEWFVLTESEKTDDGWVHSCGEAVLSARVALSHRDPRFTAAGSGQVKNLTVPFCPKCEKEPTGGIFRDDGYWAITRWK